MSEVSVLYSDYKNKPMISQPDYSDYKNKHMISLPDKVEKKEKNTIDIEKGVVRKFAKLTGRTCAKVSSFNKVTDLILQFYLKKTPAQVFSCDFCKMFKKTYFTEHLRETASVDNNKHQ